MSGRWWFVTCMAWSLLGLSCADDGGTTTTGDDAATSEDAGASEDVSETDDAAATDAAGSSDASGDVTADDLGIDVAGDMAGGDTATDTGGDDAAADLGMDATADTGGDATADAGPDARDTGYECPPPQQPDGFCVQVIAWARDPMTGECCQYPTPCHAPDGWPTFNSEQECQAQ